MKRRRDDGDDYPVDARHEAKQRHIRGGNEGASAGGIQEAVKMSEEEREKILQMVDEEPEVINFNNFQSSAHTHFRSECWHVHPTTSSCGGSRSTVHCLTAHRREINQVKGWLIQWYAYRWITRRVN